MNNKIPIKIERVKENNFKVVEWKLGNTCNYDCSFCEDIIKDGSEYWLDIDVYKNVCEQLMNAAESENKKIIFQFTGGEPTLYPKLIELLEFIKTKKHHVNLISNGARTIRWWQEIADKELIDYLFITAHTEQNCDIDHIINVTELFIDKPTFVLVQFTTLPKYFDAVLQNYYKVLENSCCKVTMKLINSNSNSYYTEEQLNIIVKHMLTATKRYSLKKQPNFNLNSKIKITFSDSTTEEDFADALIAKNVTNFFGWKCSIGVDYLNIIYDKVYRGQCRQGGVIQNIYEPIKFQNSYITCFKHKCDCATDYNERKILK
jgi:organic radical activating enzyme